MKKLQPQEVNVPTYPNGAHMNFGASSPRVRFLAFMFDVKSPLVPHCTYLLANEHNHHIYSQR
jgi:hypothetical protein